MKVNIGLLVILLSGSAASGQPVFENISPTLGITHQYTGGWEYFVGGGVATFDCDGDLFPELYIAGGQGPAVLLRNTTPSRGASVSLTPKTPKPVALTAVTGAYPLDVDSDGQLDLFIMRVGENKLLRGGPDCTFTEFTDLDFDGQNHWTTAFSATWQTGRTLPSLSIGNYVNRDDPDGPFMACDDNFLMQPTDGRYITTPLLPAYCPLSMLFTDWGRHGRADLRISNDRHYYVRGGSEQMWAMQDVPRLYSEADGWHEYSLWGMGIASRDVTGDGRPEVFLSSMGDQKLQLPDLTTNGPTYVNAPYAQGATAQRPYIGGDGRPSTGWQIEFGDVDNDGRDDVFIAKGNVEQMPDSAMRDPNNLLMQSPDGGFAEYGLTAGIATMDRSRGAVLADLNLDGRLDLVVVNRNANIEVYQNTTTNTGNWLLLDVQQSGTNPRAIGAWIELTDGTTTWSRELTVGGGHASGNASLIHFGLGDSSAFRLRVVWPDGDTSTWSDVTANQILQVSRELDQLMVDPL